MSTRAGLYGRQSRGKHKSIADQLAEGRTDAADHGWEIVAEFSDGVSASRFATRARKAWPEVLAAVDERAFDVLVLWEASRGDRTLTTWSAFLDLCRERDVKVHVVNDGRTYDLAHDTDWRTLAEAGVDSAHESAKLSKRVRRGVAASARAGRPAAGPSPYGYTRSYDPRTGELAGQDVDPDAAPIVAEIIQRVGRAEPLGRIADDLMARGVSAPAGMIWRRQQIRLMALNPVYIGKRAHHPGRGTNKEGQRAVYDAGWPAIVTEEEHYAAVRVLSDPGRTPKNHRPGRQVHLLTYLAECGRDGCTAHVRGKGGSYVCIKSHFSIPMPAADAWVRAVAIAYLERPDVYQLLKQEVKGTDKQVQAARDEARTLRGRLEMWRRSAVEGETSPASLAVIEADLTAKIAEADRRADQAALPPALRPFLEPGGDVAARWDSAPLAARRQVLALFWTIRMMPQGKGPKRPADERVLMVPRQTA